MKRSWPLLAALFASALGSVNGWAGTLSYVAIPSTQSDSNCRISRDHGYTTAVDGGNSRGTDRVLNGITLYSLRGGGQNTATADNCTFNALSGTLTDAGLTSKNIAADSTVRDVFSDMVFNNAGGDNSQVEIVLDPESLEEGATYDLRVYICSSSGQNRQVNLAFFGDGQNAAETGFFNEDDARTSPGRFQRAGQVYYINYRFTWDGDSTPGITITQKFGGAPFCLYALTNELVEGEGGGSAGDNTGTQAGATAQQGNTGEGDDGLSSGSVNQESDQVGVKSDDFYGSESLNSHGRWIKLSKWGTCWQPTDVPNGWCPYTNGSWKECDDCGWTFLSDEPWTWACYHYGRWAKVSLGCGWAWVPGKVWAPSWVSWRQGKDNSSIGWAPLPPEADCEVDVGVGSWVDATCNIGPECYTFINIRDFGADSYFGCGCIYERGRNTTIIIDTFNCTNICYGRHINIFCGGPDFIWCNTRIRQLGGKECTRIHINRFDDPNKLGGKWAKHEGNQLGLVSPKIHGTRHPRNRPKIAESAGADKIEHGWKGVKDKEQEQQLRNHIAEETKGKNPRNSPAKLPEGVAEKIKNQHGDRNAQNTGPGQGGQGTGGNLHPRAKGSGQGQGPGAQGGATGGDQHPVKARRNRTTSGNASGGGNAGPGGGFDQHPGKNRGHSQGRKAGKGQQESAGANQQGGNLQGGGARGPHHPGLSFKKGKSGGPAGGVSGMTQGAGGGSGAGGNGSGGQRGGLHQGKGQGSSSAANPGAAGGETQTEQANVPGLQGQGQGSGRRAGRSHHRQRQLSGSQGEASGGQQGQSQIQEQGQGAGQGAGAGGGKAVHQQQSGGGGQGQMQTAGGGAGGGQGQQQPHPQRRQQQGGGGGKRHRPQGTPPPASSYR